MRLTRRRVVVGSISLVVVLATILVVAGWISSSLVRSGALNVVHELSDLDMEVAAIKGGQVTLRMTSLADADGRWAKDGIWGLSWDGGYAQAGPIVQIDDEQVVRALTPIKGTLSVGERVELESYAYPADPQAAVGLHFEDVSYSSPLGAFPAWYLDGPRSTWAIFVHGREATRAEAIRLLPTFVGLGFPSLVINYRNDEGAPQSPDGFYHFGETEWEDLEGAVEFVVGQGATDIVLVGHSMGGAIVTNFLYQSTLSQLVRAVVLDSPILSFEDVIDYGATRKGIPWPVTPIAKLFARYRFDFDWGERDYLRRSDELAAPILLFHGDDDETVSIKTSAALAEKRPDIVTYVRVAGATHVRSWNMDKASYESALREFLEGAAVR